MELRVENLGFRVLSLGLRVSGSGFRVENLNGLFVYGLWLMVYG